MQTLRPALQRLRMDLLFSRLLISVRLAGAGLLICCAIGLFSSYRAAAQPVVSFTGSAGYFRLGSSEGPALSGGVRFAFPISSGLRGGWLVGGAWFEVAGVQTDPDRYEYVPAFGFFSTQDCVDKETSDTVSDTFCDGTSLTSRSFEALYARRARFLSFAFGGGLRRGEEVDRTGYGGIEERIRPYGTALLEVPVFSKMSVLLQGRAGNELRQVQAGAVFRLN